MGRRTLLIIASILVAATGTALIWLYVQNAESRLQDDLQPVAVLRATRAIDIGTPVSAIPADAVEQVPVPTKSAPPDRIGSLAALTALAGRTVTSPIFAGQFLIAPQFAPVSQLSGVKTDRMGVAVPMEDPNRVAGLLQPGSRVAVYFVQLKQGDGGSGGTGVGEVSLLMPEVNVIAIGGVTAAVSADGTPLRIGTQAGVPTTVVTLDAVGKDATRLILGSKTGTLYFTLLGAGAKGSPGDHVASPDLLKGA